MQINTTPKHSASTSTSAFAERVRDRRASEYRRKGTAIYVGYTSQGETRIRRIRTRGN